ncbi:MAG TPA: NAD(P)H-dependent oxidoreductase [Spirochaetota bacterium]|nr:NAD(P)H-dependent oxidoreductase [Spirochaetota bacterium]
MKILAIVGSSKFGNSSEVTKYFENRIKSNDNVDFETLFLSDYPIDFCKGCHNCIFLGEDKCPHREKVKIIEDKMLEADGVIFISPGYMFSVTGIMKNFLDHIAYNCHRPKYYGKKAFIIAITTKMVRKGVYLPLETFASAAGFEITGKNFYPMLPFPAKEKEIEKIRESVKKDSKKFYHSVSNKGKIKADLGQVIVFHIFRTLAKVFPNISKADYAYFTKIDGYNRRFYVDAKVSFFQNIFANFIESSAKKDFEKIVDKEKLKTADGWFRNKL